MQHTGHPRDLDLAYLFHGCRSMVLASSRRSGLVEGAQTRAAFGRDWALYGVSALSFRELLTPPRGRCWSRTSGYIGCGAASFEPRSALNSYTGAQSARSGSMVGVDMAWESASTLIAGATGIAGILATYLTARYNSKNNFRVLETERRHAMIQATLTERKTLYVRMLHALEEFDFTLHTLESAGYGGEGAPGSGLTEEIRTFIARHLEIDLTIQNIERELELVAPLGVVRECRHAFYALREMTRILTDEGTVNCKPYERCLIKVVSLMRSDLGESSLGLPVHATGSAEEEMKSIYTLNAPESAIRLSLEAADDC